MTSRSGQTANADQRTEDGGWHEADDATRSVLSKPTRMARRSHSRGVVDIASPIKSGFGSETRSPWRYCARTGCVAYWKPKLTARHRGQREHLVHHRATHAGVVPAGAAGGSRNWGIIFEVVMMNLQVGATPARSPLPCRPLGWRARQNGARPVLPGSQVSAPASRTSNRLVCTTRSNHAPASSAVLAQRFRSFRRSYPRS